MKPVRLRQFVRIAAAIATALIATTSFADANYPNRPVQLVSAFAAGSATDLVARLLADKLGPKLGTQVVVTSKPGAGGVLAAESVARAAPDGYTLLVSNPSLVTNSFLYSKVPYNVARDFAGVGLIGESPYVIIVTPDLGVKSIQELVALAKAKPKAVNYASGGLGTAMHLNCELFARKAGIELQVVPYANVAAIGPDFMSNRVQMMCVPIPSAMQFLRAGKAIPLGVTTATDISDPIYAPSIRQSTGLDVVTTSWNGVFAPAKTPGAVLQKLAKAMKEAVADPELQQKLKEHGMATNPLVLREFDDYFRRELDTWGPVIRDTGLKLD